MKTDSANRPATRWGRGLFLTLLVVALIVLHQDAWNWSEYKPLLFGFLPIGLGYHAGFAVASSVLMWLFVRLLWPKHLEDLENSPPVAPLPPREEH